MAKKSQNNPKLAVRRLPTTVMVNDRGNQVRVNTRDVPVYQGRGYRLRDAQKQPAKTGYEPDPLIGLKRYDDDATKQIAGMIESGYDRTQFATLLHARGAQSLREVPATDRETLLAEMLEPPAEG